MTKNADKEIAAIRTILKALAGLDKALAGLDMEARDRVCRYVVAWVADVRSNTAVKSANE